MECSICLEVSELISPPLEYCTHELCMSCWMSTGERNPLCPFCRCDLTKWMQSMKIDINSKRRFDDDETDLSSMIGEEFLFPHGNAFVDYWNERVDVNFPDPYENGTSLHSRRFAFSLILDFQHEPLDGAFRILYESYMKMWQDLNDTSPWDMSEENDEDVVPDHVVQTIDWLKRLYQENIVYSDTDSFFIRAPIYQKAGRAFREFHAMAHRPIDISISSPQESDQIVRNCLLAENTLSLSIIRQETRNRNKTYQHSSGSRRSKRARNFRRQQPQARK